LSLTDRLKLSSGKVWLCSHTTISFKARCQFCHISH